MDSKDDLLSVEWNERVTYSAKIRRADAMEALAAYADPSKDWIDVLLGRIQGEAFVTGGEGLENIVIFDNNGGEIGRML